MDDIFRALADPTRRKLLDALLEADGQSLSALGETLPMTRFGVMKHLRVLEDAGLVSTRRRGREKLHYLNRDPIRFLHERWVSKYAGKPQADDVAAPPSPEEPPGVRVFEGYVAAAPGRLWAAIADLPEAENVRVDPPRRLIQKIVAPAASAARALRVTWEIEPVGQACRLTVTQSPPPDVETPATTLDWCALLTRLGVAPGGTA